MKKITLLFVLFGLLFSAQSFAGNGDLFSYDKERVSSEMAELDALEALVLQDQDLSYNDLLQANNPLVLDLNYESSLMMAGMSSGPIIPSFWWGCLFGPLGVLVVYLVEEDRDETMSAFWGCVISGVLYGAGTGLWWVIGAAQ